jgi:small-conductance mechanosensitive channel
MRIRVCNLSRALTVPDPMAGGVGGGSALGPSGRHAPIVARPEGARYVARYERYRGPTAGPRLAELLSALLSLILIAWGVVWAAPAAAQDSAAIQAAEQPVAPVVLDGATLFYVRGVSAYPAERRAAEIGDRIAALAADRTIPVESLTVRETPQASVLAAAGRRMLLLVDADAQLEGVTRQVLAETYRSRIAQAVESYRRDREPAALWRSVARALAATLALALGLWLGRRILRWIRTTLERRYGGEARGVHFRTLEVVPAPHLWRALRAAIGIAAALAALAACYAYLGYILLLFPWTRALGQSLSATLLRPLVTLGEGVVGYLPNFVFLAVLALATRYFFKLDRLFFQRVSNGTITLAGFEPTWARPTERILRLLVVAFALVIAYPYIPGSGSEAFKGITILLGLIFSLGSPSLIGNLVAGQSLAFRRAFKVGDRIRIGEYAGEVTHVRLLTTYLRSAKNERIVIPNSLILNSQIVNFSALAEDAGLILHSTVGIGYETPWRQVEAMLLEAAARTPGVLRERAPFVLRRALGNFAVEYEINVYCDNARAMLALYSALHGNILDVFNEHGVQIMTPAYVGDPNRPKVVPRDEWFAAPAQTGRPGDDR